MKQTTNLALNLPEGADNYNKDDYNENFQIIDEKMKYLSDHIGGGGDANIEALEIAENGTYTAPEGVDGYNPVTVNVPQGLPDEQLIANIIADENNEIIDTVRNYTVTTGNITVAAGKMTLPNNGYIQTMIGLSSQTSYKIEIDIDNIPEPTSDARGLTLVTLSPRGNDSVYIGYDNRSTAENKTFYTYGSSGYGYPSNAINYDYFDGKTMSIYYNAVYNTAHNKWTKNISGYSSDIFRIYEGAGTTELMSMGRSGAADEIQNLKIGRPNNTLPCSITAVRVYRLNNLEIV